MIEKILEDKKLIIILIVLTFFAGLLGGIVITSIGYEAQMIKAEQAINICLDQCFIDDENLIIDMDSILINPEQ